MCAQRRARREDVGLLLVARRIRHECVDRLAAEIVLEYPVEALGADRPVGDAGKKARELIGERAFEVVVVVERAGRIDTECRALFLEVERHLGRQDVLRLLTGSVRLRLTLLSFSTSTPSV